MLLHTKSGETALLWAARKGHFDIVKMLIEFEAEIDPIPCDVSMKFIMHVKKSNGNPKKIIYMY